MKKHNLVWFILALICFIGTLTLGIQRYMNNDLPTVDLIFDVLYLITMIDVMIGLVKNK